MEQPPGFEEESKLNWVWKLQKSLYGMKQAGQVWNSELHKAMISSGWKQVLVEHALYYCAMDKGWTLVSVHIDNFYSVGTSTNQLDLLESELKSKWSITVSDGSHLLGIHISRNQARQLIHLLQTTFIDDVVKKFGQANARPISTPMDASINLSQRNSPATTEEKEDIANLPYQQLVGSLQYLAICTCLDILYAVGKLSQYLGCYGRAHWSAAVQVLQYLRTTQTMGLTLSSLQHPVQLTGMTDSDYANCLDTRRSVSGYCFSLG